MVNLQADRRASARFDASHYRVIRASEVGIVRVVEDNNPFPASIRQLTGDALILDGIPDGLVPLQLRCADVNTPVNSQMTIASIGRYRCW